MISGCLVWGRAGFALLAHSPSFSIPPQQSPAALPLIGPDGGLADVALQDLGRFLGALGLQSDPESHIPLRAARLPARDLELLLPYASTAPLDEQLQHCPLVAFSLSPCSPFLLLLFPDFSILPLTSPPFLCHLVLLRVLRRRGGVQSGVCRWRGSPLHSLVHQRSQGGEVGCCGVPSITLLNGVDGVKGKEQNAGVGQEDFQNNIRQQSKFSWASSSGKRWSLSCLSGFNRERVPEPTALRQEVKVLLSCSPLRTSSNPEPFGALDVALIT